MPSTLPSSKKASKRQSKLARPPTPSESEDSDSENEGIDAKGMERLMEALGDDGLDEFDQAQLQMVLGGDDSADSDDESPIEGGSEEEDSEDEEGSLEAEESQGEGDGGDEGSEQEPHAGSSKEVIEEASEEEEEEEEEEDEVALDEIEAGDVDEDFVPKQKVEIDNKVALNRIREVIQLDSSLPWTETLVLNYPETVEVDVSDDLNRELAFYKQALHGANLARSLASKHHLPFTRPSDYFAEMVKSDAHMERIRQRLLDESAGIKKSEDKRKEREGKKFGKQVQIEKQKERERGRKEMEERLKGLKRKRGDMLDKSNDADDGFDVAVEDAISDRPAKRGKGQLSRKARDQKYGFGGARRRSKQNTRESTDSFVAGPKGKGSRGSSHKGSKRPGKSRRMAARNK